MRIAFSKLRLINSVVFVQVLSQRTCSSFRKTTSVSLFYLRGSPSVKVFSLLNMTHYTTGSSDEFCSSSKRRSRGPVMAAKKASEGVYNSLIILVGIHYVSFSFEGQRCNTIF
jgi:hypothetical protein